MTTSITASFTIQRDGVVFTPLWDIAEAYLTERETAQRHVILQPDEVYSALEALPDYENLQSQGAILRHGVDVYKDVLLKASKSFYATWKRKSKVYGGQVILLSPVAEQSLRSFLDWLHDNFAHKRQCQLLQQLHSILSEYRANCIPTEEADEYFDPDPEFVGADAEADIDLVLRLLQQQVIIGRVE